VIQETQRFRQSHRGSNFFNHNIKLKTINGVFYLKDLNNSLLSLDIRITNFIITLKLLENFLCSENECNFEA
jgi:hypothetical protein